MARERFYPMMRMFDPDDMFDSITRGITAPFFEEHFPGFGTKMFIARTARSSLRQNYPA